MLDARRLACAAIGLVVVLLAPVAADDRIPSYLPDKSLVVVVTEEALQQSPPWKDSEKNPPVAARTAIALAEKKKSKLAKDTSGHNGWKWELKAVTLVPRDDQRWFWLIDYQAVSHSGGLVGAPPSLRLAVLMNGTLIEPEVVDASTEVNND